MTRHYLLDTSELDDGEVQRCLLPDMPPVAVYNVEGTFFATDDLCTHGKARLSEGELDGDIIECPLHGGAFCVRDGKPEERPCTIPIRTHRVLVEDGKAWLETDG